jgi:hypothetical protein
MMNVGESIKIEKIECKEEYVDIGTIHSRQSSELNIYLFY